MFTCQYVLLHGIVSIKSKPITTNNNYYITLVKRIVVFTKKNLLIVCDPLG